MNVLIHSGQKGKTKAQGIVASNWPHFNLYVFPNILCQTLFSHAGLSAAESAQGYAQLQVYKSHILTSTSIHSHPAPDLRDSNSQCHMPIIYFYTHHTVLHKESLAVDVTLEPILGIAQQCASTQVLVNILNTKSSLLVGRL